MSNGKKTVPVVKKQVPVVTITTVGLKREVATSVTRKDSPHLWNIWHRAYPKMVAILLLLTRTRLDLDDLRIVIRINNHHVFEATLQFKIATASNDNPERWLSILSITSSGSLLESTIFTVDDWGDRPCLNWKKKRVSKSDLQWVKENLMQKFMAATIDGVNKDKLRVMAVRISMFFNNERADHYYKEIFISMLKLVDIG